MQHLDEFQRYLARHRRRRWQTRIITALLVLAALAAIAMIEQLGETTSSIRDRLTVTARCPERCRLLAIFASIVAYALTTLVVAENAHDRAEHDLALRGARPATVPYFSMSTDFSGHEGLLVHREGLIGVAAGAGIVVAFGVARGRRAAAWLTR
jgi:hypothetical protein